MTAGTCTPGLADGLSALVSEMGDVTPAPVYFVDRWGTSHPLNALARERGRDDELGGEVRSAVEVGGRPVGRVVAYVDVAAGGASVAMVQALVALTAELVGSHLVGSATLELSHAPGITSTEPTGARIAGLHHPAAVAELVAEAARRVTAACAVVVYVLRDDGLLEPQASRGVALAALRRIRPGRGPLGSAAARPAPTIMESGLARRDRGGAAAAWLRGPCVLLPLASGAHVVGLLCVAGLQQTESGDAASRSRVLLRPLAERGASAMAGAIVARQMRRAERSRGEMEAARRIQRRLLSGSTLRFPGLDVAGECRAAAQIGGDYFGFRAAGEDSLVATVFDVAGHGVGAAICMTLLRSAVLREIARGAAPGEVLARANAIAAEDLAESGLFATAFVARLHRASGTLDYASAGHAEPIHWSASGRAFVPHREGSVPLGLCDDSRYGEERCAFGASDALVLYTDGVVEARDASGEPFGRHRLVALVRRLRGRPAAQILRAAWREVERHVGGTALRDDATLVVVRATRGFGPPAKGHASCRREDRALNRHHSDAPCGDGIGSRS